MSEPYQEPAMVIRRQRKYLAKPAAPQRYNPVRVVNPTSDFHTVRMNPRQNLELVLDPPSTRSEMNEHTSYGVDIRSEWLLISDVNTNRDGRETYTFCQKYDLSDYTYHTNIALGSIRVRAFDKSKDDQVVKTSVLTPHLESGATERMRTVINPQGDVVKFEPHQMLEVVVSGLTQRVMGFRPPAPIDWDYNIEYSQDNIQLRLIQKENVADRSGVMKEPDNPLFAINYWTLPLNPFLSQEEAIAVGPPKEVPNWETHFWFGLADDSIRAAHNLSNGSYHVGTICFRSMSANSPPLERRVEVVLSVMGKKKRQIPAVVKPDKERAVERAENGRILTNPSGVEVVELTPGSMPSLTIEIVSPNCIFSDLGEDSRWEVATETVAGKPALIKMEPLGEMVRWDHRFQRFEVRLDNKTEAADTEFLGAITFMPGGHSAPRERHRRLSFWMPPTNGGNTSSALHTTYSGGGSSTTTTTRRRNRSHATTVSEHEYVSKTFDGSSVRIAEVSFELTSDELTTGTRYAEIVNKVDDDKKKRKTGSANVYGFGASQTTPGAHQHSTTLSTSTPASTTSSGSGHAYGSNFLTNKVCYNPSNNEIIQLSPWTEAIIRMPAIRTDQSKEGEVWGVEVLDSRFIEIGGIRHVKVGETNDWTTEVTILPAELPNPGEYEAGSIRLLRQNESRVVFFKLANVSKPLANVRVTDANPCRHFISGNKKTPTGTSRYIESFQHNDGIIVNEDNMLLVRQPMFGLDWTKASTAIIQHPMPRELWFHKNLDKVRDKICNAGPWYARDRHMVSINDSVLLRAIRQQQPHTDLIIQAMQELKIGRLHVASIQFVSRRASEQEAVETVAGEISNPMTITKMLHVFLTSIPKEDDKPKEKKPVIVSVDNPPHMSTISVPLGGVLEVALTDPVVNGVTYPWYAEEAKGEHMKFAFLYKPSSLTKARFSFEAIKAGEEVIKFCAGLNKKFITVSVK